ncbi:S8 family serine peptidase [Peribacillus alkalitolerans]|uniref:S8 family serine peptidase n=1 Tax=Peribacillus alkalitolerans TaxID=1550385 RepID=UPI0013CF4302|nr:S8 family serine peptidase [Peribacillus alkalitolerans]
MSYPISKKLIATMMTTAMLISPSIQAIANDQSSQIAFNDKAVEINSISELSKSSTGKHVITLITGDVVTVTELAKGKSVISVEPADRAGGGARILTVGKDTYVIPNQAIAYLASDLLDKDLFNITTLIANGYDDGKQATLPVIVQYDQTNSRSVPALPATPDGSKRTHVLESIGGAAVSADKKQAKTFWKDITKREKDAKGISPMAASPQEEIVQLNDGIEKIWLDGRVKANLEQSVPQVGAPKAWASGYDGTGVKVAVLDTGIDKEHPDVAGQLDGAVSFVPGEDVLDHHAHGTHVASTVLGTGSASEGLNKGVAPGARLLVGKVLSNDGYGQDSWIIDGMEWAANNAKIVSMSLGGTEPSDGTDPMSQAVNQLSEETGALFVIAAGNTGAEGIGSPGAADAALTVGAVDKSDNLAWFSSKGPRFGSSGLKPDLVAPGVGIVAARSHLSSQGSGSYLSLDGTSMATPHVAGAAAILSQLHPDWKGAQLKDALMSTTKKLDHIKPFEGGTGRLDVAAATFGSVRATGSLDFGFFDWPHDGDGPVEKTLTYTNDSDKPVTLDLSATFTDNSGSEAPVGLLTLSANQVTVPATGKAEVTVTLDPQKGALGSRYQGQLSADVDGQTVVHTAVGMMKEDERYSLKINATDRDGSPNRAIVSLVGPNKNPEFMVVEGTKQLRLPAGIYSVMSLMDVDVNTDHAGVALVGNPEVNLNGSKTVELDARKAREYTVNVPKKNEAGFRRMEYYRTFGGYNTMNAMYILPVWVDKMYAEPTTAVNTGELDVSTRWRLIEPLLTINFKGNELDNIPQVGSTLLNGKHNFDAVYAGKGAPEDYKNLNVKGKVVVVERSDEVSGSLRAAAAYTAGAKLLITVNDGPKELSEFVGVQNEDFTLSDSPIAVASVSGTEGDELIKAARSGKLNLNVEGTPNTSYVYDLVDSHQKIVPKDLTYSPKTNELVQIDSEYKSDRLAPGAEFRWDIRPYSTYGAGFLNNLSLPSVRTEWVSAEEGTSWYHQANVLDSIWEVRQPVVTYKPGQRLEEEWFAPVVRPRFGEGYWTPKRVGNFFQFNVPSLADSGIGHTGAGNYPPEQTLKLYQGSTLIREQQNAQDLYVFNPLPVENTKYRLVSDASRDAKRWATSVSTHTEWTFWSKLQEQINTDLPLISLDYKVDTDMNSNAIAGHMTKLGLSAVQIADAPANGKISGASLEVSFNEGKTWEKVNLVREGNGWIADIKNPSKSGIFVSLRASAWDDAGNRIDQEIIKAFGLR